MDERIYIEKTIKNFIYYLEFEENKKYNNIIRVRVEGENKDGQKKTGNKRTFG